MGDIKICFISNGLGGVSQSAEPLEAHVKNGRIVRVKPYHYKNVRLCKIAARGRILERPSKTLPFWVSLAYKKRVYSPNRVLYPLKRVDWSPESRNPQNRGKSGFVRISWDEALDIIEKEIKRIKETYGLHAILVQDDGHSQSGFMQDPHGYGHYLFDKLGGYAAQIRNPDSWEGYYWGAKHVWGGENEVGYPPQDAALEDLLRNAEMVLFIGSDIETTTSGNQGLIGSVVCRWLKELGIEIIGVSPDCNYSIAIHAKKWIPIRPNTDAALYLAIAYCWIKEDTYDKKFIQTHCVGFDEFKKYVLGEQDGVPKTPDWAERITGVPSRTIKALARKWAEKRTSILEYCGGGKIRGPYSHEAARLEAICLAMQGLGKPGRQLVKLPPMGTLPVGLKLGLPTVPHYPEVLTKGKLKNFVSAYTTMPFPPPNVPTIVPKTLVADAILNPPIEFYGSGGQGAKREDQFKRYVFPPKGYPEIHMIWNVNSCYMTCWHSKIIDAYRSPKIEFIVAIHPWLENDAIFADLILPCQTIYEHDDLISWGRVDTVGIAYQEKAIEPLGESKSTYEIHRMVAQRLGVSEAFPPPEDFMRNAYEQTLAAQRGISWDEFKRRKIIVYDNPTPEEWEMIKKENNVKPGLTWYYELPEGKGLETPTGKIEIYSTGLAQYFPDDVERPAVPRYIPFGETHQESLLHPRAKKYPLLLVSNHPRWRFHSQGDDITWLREIPTCKILGQDGYLYEPLWIHPIDAEKRGIKHGDIVKVYNERGTILGGAYVTQRIMPGVVYMDHGARADLISIDPLIDRGGAINLIAPSKPTSKNTVGMVCSGYLVEVEKADLQELMNKYPEAFKRRIHPTAGVSHETWVLR